MARKSFVRESLRELWEAMTPEEQRKVSEVIQTKDMVTYPIPEDLKPKEK